jgi:2,3-bisphosphoglycerate-independent phosphoglycerate mutase
MEKRVNKKMTALIIMDGFGISYELQGNAIKLAKTPNLDNYLNNYPNTRLLAHGIDVGLPDGQMGNSEVGHLNIGAGRIVYQELTRINQEIKEGSFFNNQAFIEAIESCKKNNSHLHLMGLVSDGGVHSSINHLYALLELAKKENFYNVFIHCFTDGRDTSPTSGINFIQELEDNINKLGLGKLASIMGRYWAMDRDKRWDRVKKAYDALVLGVGEKADSAQQAMKNSYAKKITDEFINPIIINPIRIKDNDSVIFFNFRPDRARQLTRAFTEPTFNDFVRNNTLEVNFVSMTNYDDSLKRLTVAYHPQNLKNTFGEYISNSGLTQLRIAETEKYAHVTYFFSGGKEETYENEERVLIPSPKIATYDLKPEMSANEVTREVLARIDSQKYDAMILNFANCDMVGHTGNIEAAIKAVETVDNCIGQIVEKILEDKGRVAITADHGNAEKMIDNHSDGLYTAHTINPVPFILVDDSKKNAMLRENGRLSDIAPTLLEIMGMAAPQEMTGKSLIK